MKPKSFWQWLKWKIIGPSIDEVREYQFEQHKRIMGRTRKRKKD